MQENIRGGGSFDGGSEEPSSSSDNTTSDTDSSIERSDTDESTAPADRGDGRLEAPGGQTGGAAPTPDSPADSSESSSRSRDSDSTQESDSNDGGRNSGTGGRLRRRGNGRLDAPGGRVGGGAAPTPAESDGGAASVDDEGQPERIETPAGMPDITNPDRGGMDNESFRENWVETGIERRTGTDVTVEQQDDGSFEVRRTSRYGSRTATNAAEAARKDVQGDTRTVTSRYGGRSAQSGGEVGRRLLEREIEGSNPGVDADVRRTRGGGVEVESVTREEQHGDYDWSFGRGGEGDEVEAWADSVAEDSQAWVDENLRNPATNQLDEVISASRDAQATQDGSNVVTRGLSQVETGAKLSKGGVNSLADLNPGQMPAGALETVETIGYISESLDRKSTGTTTPVITATEESTARTTKLAEAGADVAGRGIDKAVKNPAEATGYAVGAIGASVIAPSAAVRGASAVSPTAGRALGAAFDPARAALRGTRRAPTGGSPDSSPPVGPGSGGGQQSIVREFMADDRGQQQMQLQRRRQREDDDSSGSETTDEDARDAYEDAFREDETQRQYDMSAGEVADELDRMRREVQLQDVRESDVDIHPDTSSGIGGVQRSRSRSRQIGASDSGFDVTRLQSQRARQAYQRTVGDTDAATSQRLQGPQQLGQATGVGLAAATGVEAMTGQSEEAAVEQGAQRMQGAAVGQQAQEAMAMAVGDLQTDVQATDTTTTTTDSPTTTRTPTTTTTTTTTTGGGTRTPSGTTTRTPDRPRNPDDPDRPRRRGPPEEGEEADGGGVPVVFGASGATFGSGVASAEEFERQVFGDSE